MGTGTSTAGKFVNCVTIVTTVLRALCLGKELTAIRWRTYTEHIVEVKDVYEKKCCLKRKLWQRSIDSKIDLTRFPCK